MAFIKLTLSCVLLAIVIHHGQCIRSLRSASDRSNAYVLPPVREQDKARIGRQSPSAESGFSSKGSNFDGFDGFGFEGSDYATEDAYNSKPQYGDEFGQDDFYRSARPETPRPKRKTERYQYQRPQYNEEDYYQKPKQTYKPKSRPRPSKDSYYNEESYDGYGNRQLKRNHNREQEDRRRPVEAEQQPPRRLRRPSNDRTRTVNKDLESVIDDVEYSQTQQPRKLQSPAYNPKFEPYKPASGPAYSDATNINEFNNEELINAQPRFDPIPYDHAKEADVPVEQRSIQEAVIHGANSYKPDGGVYQKEERLEFQIHGHQGPHSYRYGYDTGHGYNRQFRYEERDGKGYVKGRYGFFDHYGKLKIVNYTSDPYKGFHAEGAHVPKYPH